MGDAAAGCSGPGDAIGRPRSTARTRTSAMSDFQPDHAEEHFAPTQDDAIPTRGYRMLSLEDLVDRLAKDGAVFMTMEQAAEEAKSKLFG